jgi:hypothetical protein
MDRESGGGQAAPVWRTRAAVCRNAEDSSELFVHALQAMEDTAFFAR